MRRFLLLVLAAVVLAAASGPGAALATYDVHTEYFNDSSVFDTLYQVNVTDHLELSGGGTIPPTYEDFEGGSWTEAYMAAAMSQSGQVFTWTQIARQDEASFSHADHPYSTAGEWSGSLYFQLNITSIEPTSVGTIFIDLMSWVTGAGFPDYRYIDNGNIEAYGLQAYAANGVSSSYSIRWWELENAANYYGGAMSGFSVGTPYYWNLTKDGTSLTASAYSDADLTTQVGSTTTLTLHADHPNCNDLYILLAQDDNGDRHSNGDIRNLTNETATGGYYTDGNLTATIDVQGITDISHVTINGTYPGGTVTEIMLFEDGTNITDWVEFDAYETAQLDLTGITGVITYMLRLEDGGGVTPQIYMLQVYYQYDYALAMFTELLWGSGAVVGHIVLTIIIMFLAQRGTMGKLGAVIVAVVMFVEVLNNMPNGNSAYVFAVIYPAVAVGLGLDSFR